MKIPCYSGSFREDFAAFERNFNEAAKDNKVSRTDQLGVLRSALQGNAGKYIYLGEEMLIDHAWAKLKDAYGDPQKCTYRWTPEQRRKLLDRGTEHKDDLDTPHDIPQHPEAQPQTIFQDTSANLVPRKLITTSTQTKYAYTHPKRP